MTLAEALDVAITNAAAAAELFEKGEAAGDELEQAAAALRAFLERGLPFLEAADAYCAAWTKDHRNTRDWMAVSEKLAKSRGAMHDAHAAWKETP